MNNPTAVLLAITFASFLVVLVGWISACRDAHRSDDQLSARRLEYETATRQLEDEIQRLDEQDAVKTAALTELNRKFESATFQSESTIGDLREEKAVLAQRLRVAESNLNKEQSQAKDLKAELAEKSRTRGSGGRFVKKADVTD